MAEAEGRLRRQLRQWILPLTMLAAGVGGVQLLKQAKPTETRAAREKSARIVNATPLEAKALRARIVGRGVVEPEQEITVIPEVSGKVIFVSKNLVTGGSVKQGEVLLRIDPRTYQEQVAQQHLAGDLRRPRSADAACAGRKGSLRASVEPRSHPSRAVRGTTAGNQHRGESRQTRGVRADPRTDRA